MGTAKRLKEERDLHPDASRMKYFTVRWGSVHIADIPMNKIILLCKCHVQHVPDDTTLLMQREGAVQDQSAAVAPAPATA